MILVTGGSAQGKRDFAARLFGGTDEETPVCWTDGGMAAWEEFMESRRCFHFHLFVRRILKGSVGPGDPLGRETLIKNLMAGPRDRILVTDEIGCGIVPADAFERMYREETGRLCCLAAKEAQQVWRVCCGMGMRIK